MYPQQRVDPGARSGKEEERRKQSWLCRGEVDEEDFNLDA